MEKWAKAMNRQFTEEEIQVMNKYIKTCSTSQQSGKIKSREKAYFIKIMKLIKLYCKKSITVKL